ncbi:MAG TPA: hypothetical protein VNZ57_03970 [Longimicrobiales bacterium]|nr:hypothetical protein [Longimicrobiales bacterium]
MEELTRKRIMRKLEALPDAQLYQVLDYIEFLESKYAEVRTVPPSALERFAERVEDGMRARAVAASVMSRTMGALGAASRLLDDLASAGREVFAPAPVTRPAIPAGSGPGVTVDVIPESADRRSEPEPENASDA